MTEISIPDSGEKNEKISGSAKPAKGNGRGARPPTTRKKATPVADLDIDEMIRREAYFRSERRGFAAGADLQDWLEAESEIKRILECR